LLMGANQLKKENQPAAITTLRGIGVTSLHYPTAAVLIIESLMDTDPAAALVEAEAGLARRPNDPNLLIAAGFAETKARRYPQAIARYDTLLAGAAAGTIVASTEDRASAHMFRATLLDYNNQLDRAEADYRAAYELTPGNASVLNGLGYFLANRSRSLPEAGRLLQRAATMEPRSGAIIDSLGWAYYRQGRFEQAVGMLERAISLEPRSAEIADHLGDAYWRTGREVEARLEWRKAIGLIQTGELGQPDQAGLEAKIRDGLQPLPPAPERTEKTET
jgi:tetratricopeptide (TPR) repeat protein